MFSWKVNLLMALSGLALMYSGYFGMKRKKSKSKSESISEKMFIIIGRFDIALGLIFFIVGIVSLFIGR